MMSTLAPKFSYPVKYKSKRPWEGAGWSYREWNNSCMDPGMGWKATLPPFFLKEPRSRSQFAGVHRFNFWRHILLSNKTKIEPLCYNDHSWMKKGKLASLRAQFWNIGVASSCCGVVLLQVKLVPITIDGIMKKADYVETLKLHLKTWARKLRFWSKWVFQMDTDPKHVLKLVTKALG